MKPMGDKHLAILRRHMVELIEIHADLLEEELEKGALDNRVLSAMLNVPRHLFVPESVAHLAYENSPLPIGFGKTISQPFICAVMTDLLSPQRGESVLEIGTGLGYHAAILAELASHVWTVEIVEEFAEIAGVLLSQLEYMNVDVRVGDGSRGWAERGPFDKIIVAAAAEEVPPALLEQLKPAGCLVMPLGSGDRQQLTLVSKASSGAVLRREVMPVKFTRLETII